MNSDKVWLDEGRKLHGICSEIAAAKDNGLTVLAIAHFESTFASLEAALRERPLDYSVYSAFDYSTLCSPGERDGPGRVWVALARDFSARGVPAREKPEPVRLSIIVAEHHPMPARDDAVMEAAASLPCKSQIDFHTSLADPLLSRFGGEAVRSLFQRLGLDEETAISHPMVSAAIRKAQERIGKQVGQDIHARSADEWFRHNLAGTA